MNIYALYDGETLIADGSVREIAIHTGIPEGSIRWYGSKEARERNISKALIKLEEDDEMIINAPNMRAQRSFAGKAPIPSNYETEATTPVKTIYRPVQHKAWKPSPYVAQLFHNCFKNW